MTKFLLQFEGAVIKEIPVKDELTVGRRPDNDVVIDNPAVSGHHCKIVRIGETYFVEDLHSTNGLFLNAKKIAKSGLQNNDVIGIAKHALQFIDDRPQPAAETAPAPPPEPSAADSTMMFSPQKQQELASAATSAAKRKPAVMRVLKGVVDQLEYELKNRSTYIGKSSHVQIKIKGTGFFRSAPESAAVIANHQDGYFIIPVKAGYVKLNGQPVNQKESLKDGDVIQAGRTTFKFEDSAVTE